MDKRSLTERDICTKFILPAVKRAGWDEMVQVREEVYFTKGRIIVRGKLVTRGKAKKADFVLYYKPNIPIALIEAKDNTHSVGHGIQQGLDYAATLDIPFVFSSNGDGFVFHDSTGQSVPIEANLGLDAFPSPADLWSRYRAWKGLRRRSRADRASGLLSTTAAAEAPRYYQVERRQCERSKPSSKGRVTGYLLVMATGTGKTRHSVSDHLAPVEGGPQEAHPVPGRPERADRPDDGQRFPPVRQRRWRNSRPTPRPSNGRTAPRSI